MDEFEQLATYLDDVIHSPAADLAKLQLRLERARPRFLALLDTAPKNAKERASLEKGNWTYIPTGGTLPANEALVKDILFLSDALSASEDLCASYVSFSIHTQPRSGRGRAESGLFAYLQDRASLLRCLQTIWRGAVLDESGVNPGVRDILDRETKELTKGKGADVIINSTTNARGSWIIKIVRAIRETKTLTDSLRTALLRTVAANSLVTATHSTSFSDETTEIRIQYHEEERYALGQLLFFIAANGQFDKSSFLQITTLLSELASSDGASVYLLTSLLAGLDTSTPSLVQDLYPLITDSDFVRQMTTSLEARTPWAIPGLRATVQLQWSVFLEAAANSVANFETDNGDQVDILTWEAIDAGVFAFIGRAILGVDEDEESKEAWLGVGANFKKIGGGSVVAPAFQPYMTAQIETLVIEIITTRFAVMRKLRNREEDSLSSSYRGTGGRRHSRGAQDDRARPTGQLEALFLLIATIYRGSPEGGLKFWEDPLASDSSSSDYSPVTPRLAAFLRWGSECRPPGMVRAYYEMVASLSTGSKCATYAFEFLSASNSPDGNSTFNSPPSASFSWENLFGAFHYYNDHLPSRVGDVVQNAEGAGEIEPAEAVLLRSFVGLLRQIVTYSDVARATLYDNQRHKPIATLFDLLGRPIPLELKASLMAAVAAFARPGGSFGVDVARKIWASLEQSQILPTLAAFEGRDARGGAGMGLGGGGSMFRSRPIYPTITGGVLTELEETEEPSKEYPQSTAFVKLLNALIHTPSPFDSPQNAAALDTQTIPDNLGAPSRPPGVDPYVRFVIDDVLLKAGGRDYAKPTERWKLTETCLEFVEKCLASYDLGPFVVAASLTGGRNSGPTSPLAHVLIHPGFDILTRILGATDLLESILTIVTAGYDAVAQNLAGTPLFAKCVLRCLRILHRVLELQSPFLEVVLPTLGASTVSIPADKLGRLKSAVPLDQSLLYNPEAIVQIALFVACEEEDEIALLSVRILSTIAQSPLFEVVQSFPEQSRTKLNRLVGLIDASPDTLRILAAFVSRLDKDVPTSELDTDVADETALPQTIRSAILDLFLQGTQPDQAGPNLAHLLLGFNIRSRSTDLELEDPDRPDTQRTSLHAILELLAQNVSTNGDADFSLLSRHPSLAAKCYRLVRQLCLHPFTSAALSRYLRTREKFFLRQGVALPFAIPPATEGAIGDVQYSDGAQVATSCEAICAILQSEAWLLESTALELNVLATGNDTKRQVELVGTLFANQSNSMDEDADFFDQPGLEQSLPRMLEIFHALDFAWHDSLTPGDVRLNFFAELRFDSCLRQDSTGCELYDIAALQALLWAARRELQNRGMLNTPAHQAELKAETSTVLHTLVVENHRRQIQFARFHTLRAWRTLLDITLTRAFHLLPQDGRYSLLLDLMTSILPPIAAQETDRAISELLSGAAILLITKLRDEGVPSVSGEAESVPSVSPERLQSVLRAILHAILQPGVSAVVRGNLYACLLNYVQYSAKMASFSPTLARALPDESMVSGNDDLISLDGRSTAGSTTRSSSRRSALESGNLTIFQSALERLLPVICRDASVGHEVWRTVAFTALDTIIMVAEQGRATSKVLAILTKQGYLQSFVTGLKEAEGALLDTLEPDPESLNALYIYEAQLSFLIRVASTREGAEKLLNAELFVRLAQCDYLGARPQLDSSSMDFDGFLPPATERHHQLLLPALQLVVGTLVSFGAEMPVATRQALAFLSGQRENLIIALKNATTTQSIPSLREAHLIVTILSIVLPSIPDEELSTLSSYGGLHSAVLGLSAKICGPQAWIDSVLPSNDAEREEDQTAVLGVRGTSTLFSEKVEQLVESLEAVILTYHTIATRKRSGTSSFRPAWLPSLATDNAAAPTLGSSTAFLRDSVAILSRRLEDAVKVNQQLESVDSTAAVEMEEALGMPEEEGLDSRTRRDRVLAELHSLQAKSRLQVTSSLHLIEVTLLLYWRHVAFFLDPERSDRSGLSSRPEFGLGLAESLRSRGQNLPSPLDLPQLRMGITESFKPIADRLGDLNLSQATVGPTFRARESYIGTVLRRLQEAVGENI